MTPHQIALVQTSFAQVEPIAEQAAELFYARLFQLDPSLRALFKGDMAQQGRKLMQMIAAAVRGLNDLPRLVTALQGLGRRHADYRVKPADYDTVGQALIWTLAQGLKDAFTLETRVAWMCFYGVAASTMIAVSDPVAAR